jgi:hypothetical protein
VNERKLTTDRSRYDHQIRRGVWGLKSQRGDGPWLCVEVDTGELVLLDEPLPVDARFFWGFTTVRKRVKLLGSHHRYLSAELNRSVYLFLSLPSWFLPPP